MEKPIVNPQIPYCDLIPGGLQNGKMLRIQGAVQQGADRFNVNLQAGPNTKPRDDTALHLSIRLKQGYIARNSYKSGNWGDEQGNGRLNIGPGQQFEMLILPDSQEFKIAINGEHFCEFPYRFSKDRITHIAIDGDVIITLISWEGTGPSAPPSSGGDEQRNTASTQQTTSPGFGPQGYGPPPSQGYGPPQGFGAVGSQGYGPAGPQGYGPPPPGSATESGLDTFWQSAQSALAEAIASGAAEKLLSGMLNTSNQGQGFAPQNAQYGQYPHLSQSNQHNLPQFGGEGSVGGLGSVGSFFSNLAKDVFSPQQPQQGNRGFGQRNQF